MTKKEGGCALVLTQPQDYLHQISTNSVPGVLLQWKSYDSSGLQVISPMHSALITDILCRDDQMAIDNRKGRVHIVITIYVRQSHRRFLLFRCNFIRISDVILEKITFRKRIKQPVSWILIVMLQKS